MGVGHPNSARTVAHRGERAYVAEDQVRAERIVRDRASPPPRRIPRLPGVLGCLRQILERFAVLTGQAGALSIEPMLELRRGVDVKTIEQRPGIDSRHLLPNAGSPGSGELLDVGLHDGAVESQAGTAGNCAMAEGLADVVETVPQPVAGTLLVAFRPEQGCEALPGAAEIPRDGEHREKGLGASLGQCG